jgi:formylglycine-generating enzyme required for sulfatase activity
MVPDKGAWMSKFNFNEPYAEVYFLNPRYNYFPVVGITYDQATFYCKWLTEEYKKEKNRKYKNVEFKLPTKAQWVIAARGKEALEVFPWPGNSLQHSSGQWMANFYVINQIQIHRDTDYVRCHNESRYFENCLRIADKYSMKLDMYHGITTPVLSYFPNDYGLYNMSGNVEEYVREKGITKGGSWDDPGYYLQLDVEEEYDTTYSASSERGFRIVMEFIK